MSMNWIELTRASHMPEAFAIRALLESQGIEVKLPDENSATILNHILPALGYIRIQVKEKDLAHAERVLIEQAKAHSLESAEMRLETQAEDQASEGEVLARKAKVNAILGVVLVPFVLNVYSCSLLWKLRNLPPERRFNCAANVLIALAFNCVGLLGWGLVGYTLIFGTPPY